MRETETKAWEKMTQTEKLDHIRRQLWGLSDSIEDLKVRISAVDEQHTETVERAIGLDKLVSELAGQVHELEEDQPDLAELRSEISSLSSRLDRLEDRKL